MHLILLFASLAQELPDSPGKAEVLKICQGCHDLDTVTVENRTKDAWKKTVAKMGERGADGTAEEFEAIVSYLAKNFGRINVNTATAEEIVSGVGFSAKEAEAIVGYRDKNGVYKEWRDLKKVEGIDAARVDARKDHIAVN
ncbi:MAG TPA: helix-hairpin-helix domain-containing protein [Bryobacteraceae bacterium]|jgi:competence protein ComEA|nr:helix-hairpin-helix domain-containing protein [Bryobacteraceae bacterium]